MKLYDEADLANPATYQSDAELATLARRTAERNCTSSRGNEIAALRRAYLAGQYPQEMRAAILARWEGERAAQEARAAQTAAVSALRADGYTFEVEGDAILIRGQFTEELHARIKRVGGHWDGKSRGDRKLWSVPLDRAAKLARLFANAMKARAAAAEQEQRLAAAREQRREAERQERERQSAEERRRREAEQTAEDARRRRAVANRVKVRAGEFNVGDELNGRRITGFGSPWVEEGTSPDFCKSGQRWDEECDSCGRMSVVDNDSGLCERCYGGGERVRVCYAYFE